MSPKQISLVYASEADTLNIALFGIAAAERRATNPNKDGNMRDYTEASQLVCLSNLDNFNVLFIAEGMSQNERLKCLNDIAIYQMTILAKDTFTITKKEKN